MDIYKEEIIDVALISRSRSRHPYAEYLSLAELFVRDSILR
jgi:hypothetical protein